MEKRGRMLGFNIAWQVKDINQGDTVVLVILQSGFRITYKPPGALICSNFTFAINFPLLDNGHYFWDGLKRFA